MPSKMIGLYSLISRFTHMFSNKEENIEVRRYFEGVCETAPFLLAYIDKNLKYCFVNQRYAHWAKMPIDAIKNKNVQDIISDDNFDKLQPYYKKVLSGNKVNFETEMQYGNGDIYFVNLTYTPDINTNGEVCGFYACVEDLTEIKKAHQEIHQLNVRLDYALSGPCIGIWDYDLVNDHLVWDDRMYTLYRVKRQESTITFDIWSQYIHPDDLPAFTKKLEYSKINGEDFVVEFRVIWPNSTIRWIASHGRIVKNNVAQSLRIIGINIDVTGRKELELEREHTLSKAEKSARLKSEFLAGISHEILTPMNGVLGMIELLEYTSLDKQQKRFIHLASSSAKTLLTIINGILDFSKVDSEKMDLEIIDFNLVTMLTGFDRVMAERAREKGLEFTFDINAVNVQQVKGDPGRLRQILTNLIDNAIKFTSNGSVSTVISTQINDHNKVFFDCNIRDTGIGIDNEKQGILFDSFCQLDSSSTRQHGGIGLGLAIVKRLCKLLNGDISVSSTPGKGSEFTFRLEFEKSESRILEMPKINLSGLHVLVADDDEQNREALVNQLRHWDIEVTQAINCQSTIDILNALKSPSNQKNTHQNKLSVAIIDRNFDQIQGIEIGKKIREDSYWNNMKLVVVSSNAQRGDAKLFADAGFSAFFPKPLSSKDLHGALNILVDDGDVLHSAEPILTRHHIHSLSESLPEKTESEEKISVNTLNQGNNSKNIQRILLVEDNLVNQEVALGILEIMGFKVDVANDGLEALSVLNQQEQSYGIILMDCQMPKMDGYEATRCIRSGQAPDPNIPIIALTANAMKGDKEKCLEAGMSDYVSKPIDPSKLLGCINQWLGEYGEPSKTISKKLVEESEDVVWDKAGFMSRIMNNDTIAEKLIDLFKTDTPKILEEMEVAIKEDRPEQAGLLAHKLKGSVSNLGGIELSSLAQKIEAAGKIDDLTQVKDLWPQVTVQYKRLLNHIDIN